MQVKNDLRCLRQKTRGETSNPPLISQTGHLIVLCIVLFVFLFVLIYPKHFLIIRIYMFKMCFNRELFHSVSGI